jgi:hypothetical protein
MLETVFEVVLAILGLGLVALGVYAIVRDKFGTPTSGGIMGGTVTLPLSALILILGLASFGFAGYLASGTSKASSTSSSGGSTSSPERIVSTPTPSHIGSPTANPSSATPGSSSLSDPTVTISSPPNGGHLPDNAFGASGTARNIPASDSLWLVIKPPTYDRWYPVSRLNVVDSTWTVDPDKICSAGGWQNIRIFLVPNSADDPLAKYVSMRSSQNDPGVANMPASAVPEAISRVYVGADSGNC